MRREWLLWIILAILGVACLVLVLNGGDGGSIAGLPDDDFARLAYLGAWGVALASFGVFMFRSRFGEALKAAGIWAIVFAVVVGAYSFGPEIGSLKDRLMVALVPGTLMSVGNGDANRFMALRGADDHFRLDGSIDGKPVSFMVDTGASIVAMDRATARSVGIDVSRLRFSQKVMTANGPASAAPVTLDTVKVGDIVRHDVQAAVTDGDFGSTLLGMSFLNTLTSFDFRGERLILTD